MTALNPADCKWMYSHTHREWDLNGTVVANVKIYVCVTDGHLGHWVAR
ncbi:hypothetical protein [Mycobacterium numidiamassiliense]|nr:hypothetical protein [Mycobacterium numidiamassiliense]